MTGIVLIPVGGPSLVDLALPYLVALGALLLFFLIGYLVGVRSSVGIVILSALLLSSCSTTMPTLSQQLKKPVAVEETINFSDAGILSLLEEQYQQWGGKSVRSQWATVTGPIVLDAVVTAMHLAASRGASSSSLVSGSLVMNFFRRVFLGVDPEARLRAYNGGLKLLREAEFAYLTAVATRHRGRIPNNRITAAGAQLLGAVLKAQDKVEDVIFGIVQKDIDSVGVQQAIDELIAAGIEREKREAAEEEAEKIARLKKFKSEVQNERNHPPALGIAPPNLLPEIVPTIPSDPVLVPINPVQ